MITVLSDKVSNLVKSKKFSPQCISKRPNNDEIIKLCKDKNIDEKYHQQVIQIFANIKKQGTFGSAVGGAAADSPDSPDSSRRRSLSSSSEEEDDEPLLPEEYLSEGGYTQGQQESIVDCIILSLLLGSVSITMGAAMLTVSNGEQFLVDHGWMNPLCKGPLDRSLRTGMRTFFPEDPPPTCEESLAQAQTLIREIWVALEIPAGLVTWAGFSIIKKELKDRIFKTMAVQGKDTRNKIKLEKKKKKRLRRRLKRSKKKSRSPDGPSGSNHSRRQKKHSRSRSR